MKNGCPNEPGRRTVPGNLAIGRPLSVTLCSALAPIRNFGVTTPVWDRLAGTYDDPAVVTVPCRMAPVV